MTGAGETGTRPRRRTGRTALAVAVLAAIGTVGSACAIDTRQPSTAAGYDGAGTTVADGPTPAAGEVTDGDRGEVAKRRIRVTDWAETAAEAETLAEAEPAEPQADDPAPDGRDERAASGAADGEPSAGQADGRAADTGERGETAGIGQDGRTGRAAGTGERGDIGETGDTDGSAATGGTIVAHAVVDVVEARTGPYAAAPLVESFAHPTERGGPLVFQAIEPPRHGWLKVLLPVRPNGTIGWVRADEVDLTINPFAIEVDVDEHRLTILRNGEERLRTEVAIGTGATPTPIGEFYLVELLRPSDPDGVYGPFAYGLSGFSETLDSFAGGEGIIGIHGTDRPDLIGQDVSHGCIRVANPTIEEMVGFLPLGTPVRIHRDEPADRPAGDRTA